MYRLSYLKNGCWKTVKIDSESELDRVMLALFTLDIDGLRIIKIKAGGQ